MYTHRPVMKPTVVNTTPVVPAPAAVLPAGDMPETDCTIDMSYFPSARPSDPTWPATRSSASFRVLAADR
ncbi:MAG: hypothetical protein GIKADHBN_03344 [Phycisphaerales bacterium]|nr:hypothetical protein [Phycisphaerales bacterium]